MKNKNIKGGLVMALTRKMMKVCIEFLKAGLVDSKVPKPPIWQGVAKNWQCFNEPEFKKFAKENGILPDTLIAVRKIGPDSYSYAFKRSDQ